MSAGLFTDHQEAPHDFKNPSFVFHQLAADHCSNGAIPKPAAFSSASPPSSAYISSSDPNLRSFNRYTPLHTFPLDAAQQVSSIKLRSFNGELRQTLPPAGTDPSALQHFASPSTHVTTTAPSSCAAQLCMGCHVGSSTGPPNFTANFTQKADLNVRNAADQGGTSYTGNLQLSDCDYAERIKELRAALLRRSNVSKPAAVMQNSFDLQAECSWGEQQHAEGDERDGAGGSFLCKKGVQSFQEADPQTNYLGRLRVAAASVGSLTNQPAQKPTFPNNISDQAKLCFSNQGVFTSQAPAALDTSFKKASSRDLINVEGDGSNGDTTIGGFSKLAISPASGSPSLPQSKSQNPSVLSSIDRASTMGDFRRPASCKGTMEDSAGNFMKLQASKPSAKAGAETSLQRRAAGEFTEDNQASSSPRSHGFTQARQPAVGSLGPYNQASLGGFTTLYQSSLDGTAFNGSDSDSRPFSVGTLGHFDRSSTVCTSLSPDNKKSADPFIIANQASAGGFNQENKATLLSAKEEAADILTSKLNEIQAHELRSDCGNGHLTELKGLQAKAAAAVVSDPQEADGGYMGDLQASILAQGGSSLQRFLPSNDEEESDFAEEELLMEGALFGSDEFRMYEFKVRLCMRERSHDWTQCPFAHPGEKARRRDPRLYHYSAVPCPDFRKAACKRGDACELSHGVFECWLHPSRYRTQICKDGKLCKRKVCFFAHSPSQFRAISASGYSSAQKQDSQYSSLPRAQHPQNTTQSFDGSPLRLLQHLPRYYQALLKQDLNSSQNSDPHLNIPSIMPTLINHPLCQYQYGGMEAAAPLPVSFDSSHLRLAMAYGLPINVDGGILDNFNRHSQSVSSPRSPVNLPSCFDSFGSSNLLQDAASASGFLCCKSAPATNYVTVDDLVSMHSHNSYGRANPSVPHLQTDGPQMRALHAAALNGVTRPIIQNGEVCNGVIPGNKLALTMQNSGHQVGLPSSHFMFSNASSNWNVSPPSPPLPQFMPLNLQAPPSLDAVSQAQAVLTAHALAQNRASEHHMPSSPIMSPHARHHLEMLNTGTQGPTIPVNPLNSVEYIHNQHHQDAARGLDSPQAMTQLIASIQQLELRCATAEMKNNLMMAQAAQQQSGNANNNPSIANSKTHEPESWDGAPSAESGAGPCHRVDVGGSLKGPGTSEMLRQADSACTANILGHKGSFDLEWVDELI